MKECTSCLQLKNDTEFSANATKKDKLQTECRECRRKFHRAYYRQHGAKMREQINEKRAARVEGNRAKIVKYLQEHPCIDCGEKDIIVLEFDHRHGMEKVGDVAKMVFSYSWERILLEIEKCDVRCANCHRRRTASSRGYFKTLY